MIAASEPQEFIPCGRQHVSRHPGNISDKPNQAFGSNDIDDLMLHRFKHVSIREESTEWWIIRESNRCECVPKQDVLQKHDKTVDDCSWRTIDPKFGVSTNKSDFDSKSSYSMSRLQVSSNANSNVRCNLHKLKCKSDFESMEEELYVKGNTAVWSKGLLSTNPKAPDGMPRVILCSYTMDTPIKHALWCTFYLIHPSFSDNNTQQQQQFKWDEPLGDPLSATCLIDSYNMRVFTRNNEDFITSLQFQITAVWTTKFGILVEKENAVNPLESFHHKISSKCMSSMDEPELNFTHFYSLSHPLDEFSPVVFKHTFSQNFNSTTNSTNMFKIIYTSCTPSICLIYDSSTGLHYVYRLKRIKADEWIEMSAVSKIKSCNTFPSPLSISNKIKHNLSFWSNQGIGLPLATGSPCSSRTSLSNLVSPHNSRSHSPMATISRCQSPSVSPFVSGGGWVNRSTYLQPQNETYTTLGGGTQTDINAAQMKPINPELCLEHIWTETVHSNKSSFVLNSGPASKAFICNDLVGQNYLCYLIPLRGQLVLVKMDTTNDNNLIFGTSYFLNAKDAISVPNLNMIAILDSTGQMMLYSGPFVIGKLHTGGVSAEFATCLNLPQTSNFKSPFPRRSSLLPHCVTPAVPKFDEHLISPVYPPSFYAQSRAVANKTANVLHSTLLHDVVDTPSLLSAGNNIVALRDPVSDRITLQYSNNTWYRVRIPTLASSTLVDSCLNVFRLGLQRDVTMGVFCKWYAARNAPGPTDFTVEQEWALFAAVLYNLLGYDTENVNDAGIDTNNDEIKRQRPSPQGNSSDWEEMLQSEQHNQLCEPLMNLLHLKRTITPAPLQQQQQQHEQTLNRMEMNTNAVLFPYFRLVLFLLHLLYEEIKLNTSRWNELPFLAKFLHRLACDLRLVNYVVHYWKDYPDLCPINTKVDFNQLNDNELSKINPLSIMTTNPVSIMEQIYHILRGLDLAPYPFVKYLNPCSKNMLQICGLIAADRFDKYDFDVNSLVKLFAPPGSRIEPDQHMSSSYCSVRKWNWIEKVVVFMNEIGISRRDLDYVPVALNLLIHEVLWQCRENPPTDWPADCYYLLQRPDLAVQASQNDNQKNSKNQHLTPHYNNEMLPNIKQYEPEHEDGMEDIEESVVLKLRFSDDRRIAEVRRLLQSSEPVNINVVQQPDVSDHDLIEEQEKHLYAICTRTMALPVGRGMFTMRTTVPVVTEPLPIPKLCLSGRAPPRGGTIELAHIDTPPNMNLWPMFHNGVAAGLRINPDASDIDSTWIVFNKPKSAVETPVEHGGFLMALGLNGHLKKLAVLNMYEYLVKCHEMTNVGILLGFAATKRGTMDTYTTKMLSIFIEALMPPTSMELDIQQNAQVAALLGLGLVYEGSAHQHIADVLLSEIGRPPGPEMENSVDRESYSLAAGLGLGLVMLKQGDKSLQFTDLGVSDTLHYYMVGGNKRPLTGSQKEKYKVASFQIREGSAVNLDVTAPGATLALGLMYLGTGNRTIANWMEPPDTQYLLDFIRPDFLMLRTIAKALIMWDEIETSISWIEKQVPQAILPFCLKKPSIDIEMDIDYEAMNQAYCNIVAGACFALGLRYAGSADENAFLTLYHYCRMFTSLTGKSIAELAGKPTIETCLNLILLSLGMVMAGTGRLEVLRLCRYLRTRVGIANSSVVTYGSHLVTHMTLGLLFLGGGCYTLSNSPGAVAAMLCAFFPKFPTHSNDNRYHLQAFRHLYVLAVEPRLLVPRDVLTSQLCYTKLSLVKLNGECFNLKLPCILPALDTLARVSVQDERYWPIVFERGRNWDQLHILLDTCGCIEVKQRAGCLSYLEDPIGARSLLARTLTQTSNIPWTPLPNAINSFSSEPTVKYFTENFLTNEETAKCHGDYEQALRQMLTMIMYECVTKDKVAVLPIWITFIKTVHNLKFSSNANDLWQLKLFFTQVFSSSSSSSNRVSKSLISPEVTLSLKQQIFNQFDQWESELIPLIKSYLTGHEIDTNLNTERNLVNYLIYFDIPYNIKTENNLHLIQELQNRNASAESISKVLMMSLVN